jgi:hypothetical protein
VINLNITEEQFNELYPDMVGYYSFFDNPPPSCITSTEFEQRYLSSKLWRLNNIYWVTDKSGTPCVFRMKYAQHCVYARSRTHKRQLILKSRQQGISTLWLVSYCDDAIWAPFVKIGLMAQGTDEASALLERTKFLWDKLDLDIKAFANVSLDKDNSKEFSFSNESKIFIRVSFRSNTLQRLHVSEMGKIANQYPKRAREVKTGTLQALAEGNTGIIESTAEGRNMFKDMWDEAVVTQKSGQATWKDFYPTFLSWLDDPDCNISEEQTVTTDAQKYFEKLEEETGRTLTVSQKNFWIVQYRELGEEVYQEYPATAEEAFRASRDGTYYSRLYQLHVVEGGKLIQNLYDENLPLDVYVDLGVDDYFVLGFIQWHRGEWRIVREYWNNGYSLEHYLDFIKDSGLNVRSVNFPHDVKVRELGSKRSDGTAKTRLEIVEDYVRDNRLRWIINVLAKSSVADGIEATRRIIPHLAIDPSCTYLIDCLNEYSKEWDEKLQAWKPTPLHDEYSHGADMLRQMAANTVENLEYHKSRLANSARVPVPKGYAV